MPQQNFKYYISYVSSNVRYYCVSNNGTITATATKTALPINPKGWHENKTTWQRGFEYYGVITNYSTPLEFTNEGAEIIMHELVNNGYGFKLQLIVERFNYAQSVYDYQQIYIGDLDLTTITKKANSVTVVVIQGGTVAQLKANERTVYDIELSTLNPINVQIKGYENKGYFQHELIKKEFGIALGTISPPPPITDTISSTHIDSKGFNSGDLVAFDTSNPTDFNIRNDGGSKPALLRGYYEAQYRIGSCFSANINITVSFQVEIFTGATIHSTHVLFTATHLDIGNGGLGGSVPWTKFSGVVNFTTTVPAGARVRYVIKGVRTGGNLGVLGEAVPRFLFGANSLECEFKTITPSTFVQAVRPSALYRKLIEKITGNAANANPSFFTKAFKGGTYDDVLITSGAALRKLSNTVIKTSLVNFYKAFASIDNVAILHNPSNDTIEFADLSRAFDTTTQNVSLGKVANFELKVLREQLINGVEIGYPNFEYDDVNGKDEYNITSLWTTEFTNVQDKGAFVSPYRADGWGIEFQRQKYLYNNETKDVDQVDTACFLLHVTNVNFVDPDVGSYVQTYHPPLTTLGNHTQKATVALNLSITPRENLLRKLPLIRPLITTVNLFAPLKIASQSTNYPIGPLLINGVSEIADVALNAVVGANYFDPYTVTCDAVQPLNLSSAMLNNMHGYVALEHNGLQYEGFIMALSETLAHPQTQEYTILLKSNSQLI